MSRRVGLVTPVLPERPETKQTEPKEVEQAEPKETKKPQPKKK